MKRMQKERRQIEIVALVQGGVEALAVADLCAMFNCEVATIHRDLRTLRERGVQIHSVKGKVQVVKPLLQNDLQTLLSLFIPSVSHVIAFPQNIVFTARKLKQRLLPTFVSLVQAIEKRHRVELTYYKMFEDATVHRIVEPYSIVPTERDWRLVARSDGVFKQFIVDNVRSLKVLEERFKRDGQYDVSRLYRGSFGYWMGEGKHRIILRFSKKVAGIIREGMWSEDQEIRAEKDGSVTLTMSVNSLEEAAHWVMRWGGEVRVVGPNKFINQIWNWTLMILRAIKGK